MWYSPTPVCLFNPVAHGLGNKGCAACDGLLSVSPAGEVLPCSSWPEPVGSLLDEPFHAVWNTARGAWIRDKKSAPEGCDACEDFALCQGACPLYWRHFGFAELQEQGGRHVAAGG
jgi:radical SAM protein with 4Fe4S-binding SPASM domain